MAKIVGILLIDSLTIRFYIKSGMRGVAATTVVDMIREDEKRYITSCFFLFFVLFPRRVFIFLKFKKLESINLVNLPQGLGPLLKKTKFS